MKTKIFVLVILFLVLIGGFISFEKKKKEYGDELENVRSAFIGIKLKQSRIEDLKKKRAEYFRKVFIINRPGDENKALASLMSVLIMMDNREVRFSDIRVDGRPGTLEFRLSGFSRSPTHLLDFTDKLESSAGAFITSRTVDEKNSNGFELKGEVSVE